MPSSDESTRPADRVAAGIGPEGAADRPTGGPEATDVGALAVAQRLSKISTLLGPAFNDDLADLVQRHLSNPRGRRGDQPGSELEIHPHEIAGASLTLTRTEPWRLSRGLPESPFEDRFSWLFGQAAPRVGTPSTDEAIAAADVALRCWNLLALTGPRLIRWAADALPEDQAERVRDRAVAAAALVGVQLEHEREVANELDRRGLPWMLMKGSAVRRTAYPDPIFRSAIDFDVAVARDGLREAEATVHGCGYRAADWNMTTERFELADPVARAMVNLDNYELGFLVKRVRVTGLDAETERAIRRSLGAIPQWHLDGANVACYVQIDVHWGLTLNFSLDEAVQSSHRLDGTGGAVRVPSLAWSMFFSVFKLYWEGIKGYGRGTYQLADLAYVISKMTDRDATEAATILDKQKLDVPAFYLLRRIPGLMGVDLPDPLQTLVDERTHALGSATPVDLNDWGDVWPKLWRYR